MPVPDKFKLLLFLLLINIFIPVAKASNLDEAISAYNSQNYEEALDLLDTEIKANPNNPENYKWLAKTYEAMFNISKSLEAYKNYEKLKRNQDANAIPSLIPTPSATPRPTPKPTIVPTPRPTPKPTLSPIYTGWTNIKISNYAIKKEVKIIPASSVDMNEITEKASEGKRFVWVECKISYSKNIIIKSNSDQIRLIDKNNDSYYLYAMSTYRFNYGGSKASKKIEVLQISDYFELSKKDSRNKIQLLFKVNSNADIKQLSIKGYGNLAIK